MEKNKDDNMGRDSAYRDFLNYDSTGSDGKSLMDSFYSKISGRFPSKEIFVEYVNMRESGKSSEEANEFVENSIKDSKLVGLANSLKLEDLKGKKGLGNIKNVLFKIGQLGFDFTMLDFDGYDPSENSWDIRKFYDLVVLYANDQY